jgi:D-serine deaminase-like pyridoxal phosphate-dependent protein
MNWEDPFETTGRDTLATLDTPCLLLDEVRMERNIERLRSHLDSLGVELRPHLKTPKSIEVARRILNGGRSCAAVSTLKEAALFAEAGVRDILYCVGVTPNKLDRVAQLRERGAELSVIVDSVDAARAVAAKSRQTRSPIPTLIEIDSDGHRAGVSVEHPEALVAIGRVLHDGGAQLRGVLTHAGESYNCKSIDAIVAMAERERAAAVTGAQALRAAGLPSPVVSVGSTPTALFARDLTGVTEVRAGVFVFFDLVMAGLGVCSSDDVALSVLATVIGHQRDKGWILVDAGWMAMSRDRGTSRQRVDQGYGMVCDIDGRVYPDLIMVEANQEQGILALRPGSAASLPDLQVGAQVRLLPNHACATGAQHDAYHVVRPESRDVLARWRRFSGW